MIKELQSSALPLGYAALKIGASKHAGRAPFTSIILTANARFVKHRASAFRPSLLRVEEGASHLKAQLAVLEDLLRRPHQEVAAGGQGVEELLVEGRLRFVREVDDDVAAQDDVETRPEGVVDHVEALEGDAPLDLLIDVVGFAAVLRGEVLRQVLLRRVDQLGLDVVPLLGDVQSALVDVHRQDRRGGLQPTDRGENRQGVGLLPRGAARAPQLQAPIAALLRQLRNDLVPELPPLGIVSKELRHVDRQVVQKLPQPLGVVLDHVEVLVVVALHAPPIHLHVDAAVNLLLVGVQVQADDPLHLLLER